MMVYGLLRFKVILTLAQAEYDDGFTTEEVRKMFGNRSTDLLKKLSSMGIIEVKRQLDRGTYLWEMTEHGYRMANEIQGELRGLVD